MILSTIDWAHLLTPAGLLALLNVILIDVVLSGDNAIVIGMATKDLRGPQRRKAIMVGIVMATALRVAFASTAVFLLKIVGLKLAGGLLLLYVVWKFYRELRGGAGEDGAKDGKQPVRSLWSAVWLIILADVSMSLDNVLAVAGAARESLLVLAIGLLFSILLMAVASSFIASRLERYPQIQWAGLIVILFVAIEMLLTGVHDIENRVLHVNLLPFLMFLLAIAGFALHRRYITPARQERVSAWFATNWPRVVIANLMILLALVFFGGLIHNWLAAHPAAMIAVCTILLFAIIEMISTVTRGRPGKGLPPPGREGG